MTIERYDIYIDFDGFPVAERFGAGEFIKAADAPPDAQRVSVVTWNAGTCMANLSIENDDEGEWVLYRSCDDDLSQGREFIFSRPY